MPIETKEIEKRRNFILSRFIANAYNIGDITAEGEVQGRYLVTEEALYKIVDEILEYLD